MWARNAVRPANAFQMLAGLVVRRKAVDKLNQCQIQVVRFHGVNLCETLLFVKCIVPFPLRIFVASCFHSPASPTESRWPQSPPLAMNQSRDRSTSTGFGRMVLRAATDSRRSYLFTNPIPRPGIPRGRRLGRWRWRGRRLRGATSFAGAFGAVPGLPCAVVSDNCASATFDSCSRCGI